ERIANEKRARAVAVPVVVFPVALLQVRLPDELSIDVEAGEMSGPEERPHVLPIGRGRGGRAVAFVPTEVLVARAHALPPELLSVPRDTEDDEITPRRRGDEDAVAPDRGSGPRGPGQLEPPGDVFRPRPLEGQVPLGARPIAVRAPPPWPVL